MQQPDKPINLQAALFLSRKRHTEKVSEALDSAAMKLTGKDFKDQLAMVFSTDTFGPEPEVKMTIIIRKDVQNPGRFAVSHSCFLIHHLGDKISLFGLKPE